MDSVESVEEASGVVVGAVVDDDDFEVGVVDGAACGDAGSEAGGSVAGADDDGKLGSGEGRGMGRAVFLTASRTGLAEPSRRVRPKDQSVMVVPLLNQSSDQA